MKDNQPERTATPAELADEAARHQRAAMPPRCRKCGQPVILIGGTTVHKDGADGIWCALLNPAGAS